MSAMNIQ